jgi:hypothetical protein
MAKCSVWGCPDEAMEGSLVCEKHFLEDVHRILDEGKRERERKRRIAENEGEDGGTGGGRRQ